MSLLAQYIGVAIAVALATNVFAQPRIVDFTVQLDVVRQGYDGVQCWVHPRAGIVPQRAGPPAVIMTMPPTLSV